MLPREQLAAQTSNLPLVPTNQEGTMVENATLERIELERTIALATQPEVVVVISKPDTAPPTTPMPIQVSITASQDIAPTPATAKTQLLLTSGP